MVRRVLQHLECLTRLLLVVEHVDVLVALRIFGEILLPLEVAYLHIGDRVSTNNATTALLPRLRITDFLLVDQVLLLSRGNRELNAPGGTGVHPRGDIVFFVPLQRCEFLSESWTLSGDGVANLLCHSVSGMLLCMAMFTQH